jgi:hypothetical protein
LVDDETMVDNRRISSRGFIVVTGSSVVCPPLMLLTSLGETLTDVVSLDETSARAVPAPNRPPLARQTAADVLVGDGAVAAGGDTRQFWEFRQ